MNCTSSLSSLLCIVSASLACTAGAQTPPAALADAPVFASSTLLAPVPQQRSAQTTAKSAAVEPAAAASEVATSAFTLPAAAPPESRAQSKLRRPIVPGRPHRPQAASAPANDVWSSDTLYTSPYAKSPYAQPGDQD